MTNTRLPLQAQSFTLAGSGAAVSATNIILKSFQDIDGTNITMSDLGTKAYMTLEPNNGTREEQISFTGVTQNSDGTATLSGVSNVAFKSPYTETSGVFKAHAGGSIAVLTNTAGFYNDFANKENDETINGAWTFTDTVVGVTPTLTAELATKGYVDSIAVSGAPDASTSVKGITKLATAPVSAADPIAVGDNDPRLPTTDEKDALVGTVGTPSSTNPYVTSEALTGVISIYGGSTAPTGWMLCDGTAVSRTTYSSLFTILGVTYGAGDGSTTFNLPNLKGKVVVGLNASETEFDALGETGGAKTHTLTISEMPAHDHTSSSYTTTGSGSTTGAVYGNSFNGPISGSVPSQGGGGAHNNLQPYMVLNYIIKS